MNSGVVDEGGQTARTLISTMKDSPLTLSLVLFNIVFLGLVGYSSFKEREWRAEIFEQSNNLNLKYATMLYNCTPNKGVLPGGELH